MLKVDSSFDARRSRTSLASIFEDLVSLRKSFLHRQSSTLSQRSWVEKTFFKRECSRFIKSSRDPSRCCCGRSQDWHGILPNPGETPSEKWHPLKFTEHKPTDAYGTIEFQGAPHPSKAQYVRMSSYDTRPEHVLHLLQKHWGLDLPKLLITVHGGILNFDIQPKLKRVFRKGLLKAARTTGAWIITGGTNTGVTKHVGDAISDRTSKTKNKVVAIGIAPWGVVENKESLIGRDITVPYHCVSSPKTNTAVLNSNHSYFLLLDNGTVGKYGGEIIFRKKFEKFIAQQKICITSPTSGKRNRRNQPSYSGSGVKGHGVPVICVVLEGGANTIRSVLEYVTDTPPVPVVVCDGSGRAADLLAFTHKYTLDDGTMPESLRDQLILTIQKTFQYSQEQAEKLFIELMLCVKKKELITVFRMGEGSQDIDLAILTALLKGTNASASDQLNLALTWDRVDIARSHIFVYGQEWPEGCLEQAMMDALIHDRVDFVKLLLENGVSMHTFLTIPRLEELYNTHHGPTNTLRYLVRDATRKHLPSSYRYSLPDVGLVIQLLMGGAFRSSYCRRRFRQKYNAIKQNGVSLGNVVTAIPQLVNCKQAEELFPYPFHDLMIWAVLMKRQKMALFMWQHGEEALAKALMACKMYKAMAHEADQDDLEIELSQEFHQYAKEFQTHALELLEHCYKIDDDYTQQLLTYELKNFSEQTSLGLAVMANHLDFIAHTCCQLTLNDLWIGGLRTRKNLSFKVILGILAPPFIAFLDFKSKEELQLMPQTMEEHLEELEDGASDFDAHSINSSFDDDQVIENDFGDEVETSFHSGSPGPAKENGSVPADISVYSHIGFKKKKSPLRFSKKIYEFYNAPITKFWTHTMAYLFFIICFIYTVLDRPKSYIQWPEYAVMSYIFTCALEKVRQIISSEPAFVWTKIRVFLSHAWNIWDLFAIALFSVGVGLRMYPNTLAAANLVYVTDLIFWIIRVLEILSVNKYLGPYVKIICKLLIDMMYFLLILFLVVTSFGIVRQVVHFQNRPNTPWSYTLRNVWFYPYWNIYGELFADEIDPCDPESPDYDKTCVYGSWLAPFIMTIYLLVANILMVNLLIARFNSTFIRNNAMSTQIWKFQRYQLIIGYENRTILPPPLTIFSHVFLIFKFIRRCCRGHKRDYFDNGLKLFLSHEDTEKLHDFEEECMEDYFRDKEVRFQNSSEERIRVVYDRVENMSMRMDDMNQKENTIKLSLQSIDYRMNRLEELSAAMADSNVYLRNLLMHNLTGQTSVHGLGSQETPPEFSEEISSESHGGVSRAELKPGPLMVRSESGLHTRPSPVLVHSQQPINAQELEKYTSRARQSSSGSVNLREFQSVSGDSETFLGESQSGDSLTAVPVTGLSLTNRRHGPTLRSINISKARAQPERPYRGTLSPNMRTTLSAPPIRPMRSLSNPLDGGVPVISTAHIHSDTQLVTPKTKPTQLSLSAVRRQDRNDNALTPISPEVAPLSPSKSIPHTTAAFITADMAPIPTSAVRDLSSILTPLQAEYTSITDDIDTSCMQDRSPQRSPTTAGVFFSESFPDPGEKPKEAVVTSVELESLKMAEEVERRRIDKLIRPRLRQISLDENDTKMSEIAKRVVDDLDKDEDSPAVEEEEEEADSEEMEVDDPIYEGGIEITISAALSDSSGEESKPVA